MPTTTRSNVLDELYLHLDRADEPWTVHVEIRVDGPIDVARLEAAVREATGRHPLARAQLAPSRATHLHFEWIIADELADIDLREVTCPEPEDLDRAREQLLNQVPSLDRPGPFSLLLAHTGDGDVIVLNLHHAAGDGLSALRLLGSIARAYAHEHDPVPEIDPLELRDVGALTAPGSTKERLDRSRAALDYLSRGVSTPTRIAPQGAITQPGYGFSFVTFQGPEVERLSTLRSHGATINDSSPRSSTSSSPSTEHDNGAPRP